MITLNQSDKEKLQKALGRATDLTLRSTDVDGVYFVYSPNARLPYMVIVFKQDGRVFGECQCKANQFGNICRHLALALADYKAKLETKKHLCASCGIMPVVEADGTCNLCIQEDQQDLEEFLLTEVLQPRYRWAG